MSSIAEADQHETKVISKITNAKTLAAEIGTEFSLANRRDLW